MSSPERDAVTTAATSSPLAPGQFTSWQAVADYLRGLWGDPDAAPELGAVAEMIVAAEPTPAGRIARALAYVRRDVRSTDEPLRLDRAPNAPGEVLRAAAGGEVDRAALLWHLLRRVGLPARPVFVGATTSAGDSAPSLAAFDRVLVEVAGRCHSVDAPDAERDRPLTEAPLGLTLAPGIVDLEPIAPWQPTPTEPAAEAGPKPPPIALRPAAAPPKPVQVEFAMDFASLVTARAAEVEAALFAPIATPPARKPATPRESSTKAAPEAQILTPRAAPPAPTPAPVAEPVKPTEIPIAPAATTPEPTAEETPPISSEPTPPPPLPPEATLTRESWTMASPEVLAPRETVPPPAAAPAAEPAVPAEIPDAPAATTPEPSPEVAPPRATPSPQPAPAEPIAEADASIPPPAKVVTPAPEPEKPVPAAPPSAMKKSTPREPARRPSLREDLEKRARSHGQQHGQTGREPRKNPASVQETPERSGPRRAPVRVSDDSPRTEYEFDPTHRARRRDMAGQLKIALMVIGFLAVIALWIFVFMAKRGPQ